MSWARAATGDSAGARALVRELDRAVQAGHASPASLAIGYAGLGDRAATLQWLERAREARDGMLFSVPLNSPWFAALWDDPGFAALRSRMGLAELPAPTRR